jgi:WD40 repeat protein
MHWRISDRAHSLTAAAFSGDVTRLAAGDGSGRVRLFETAGRLLREWPADRIEATALAWSSDNRLVAVGLADGSVKLWDATDGTSLHRWPAFPVEVGSILFDPDGHWVLAGTRMNPMTIWDVVTGRQVLTGSRAPWEFSRDGRTISMGGNSAVAFGDLDVPQTLRMLNSHLSTIEQLAWSRDNRHLVTLDNRFEVHVWDVERGRSIDEFRPPRGTYYATSAAVALSDDSRLVAYASGGGPTSHALIRDVLTRTTLARWELPDGFERLAYADGKFLLVREELDPGQVAVVLRRNTAVRELTVGKTPEVARIVRPPESSEDKGFLLSSLTPDGRLYLWVGPREPPQHRRVEIHEVATGRLLRRIVRPASTPFPELTATLDLQGRGLSVGCETGERLHFDLTDAGRPPERTSEHLLGSSPDNLWTAFLATPDPTNPTPRLSLRRRGTDTTWLRFTNDDLSGPRDVRFSPDGRFLAWGGQDGTLRIADLPALKREVRQFEEGVISR